MSEKRFRVLKHSILDTWTGLEWQKDSPSKTMTWDRAMKYAKSLRLGRHADWRLPNIEELLTLIAFSCRDPASMFPGMPAYIFWSSSSYPGSSSSAWFVSFNIGYVYYYDKTGATYARCVRRGPWVFGPSG